MKNPDIPYELIAKYFKNECDATELKEFEIWRKMSESNEMILEELLDEWLLIHDKEKTYPDKDHVWEKVSQQVKPEKIMLPVRNRRIGWSIAGIAASVALLIGIASTFFIQRNLQHKYQSEQITVISALPGQKTNLTLPDGTQVWLNSDSRISYSANFNNQSREISLEGEAFFDVTKNPDKKFIVNTNDMKVTVLGTAFDIMAYPEDSDIRVSLLRGKVALSDQTNHYLGELHPNQLAVISKKDMKCIWYDNNDAEIFSSWIQNKLIFDHSDIHEVIAKLERWYGVEIDFTNPDERQKYSFTVKIESLPEILNLFNKITPISYSIEGEEVKIIRK